MTPVSQDFMVSYQQADEFPSNGIPADTFPHTRKSYADRLNEEKDRIFCSETDAQVHILELHEQGQSQSKEYSKNIFVQNANIWVWKSTS